MATPTIKEPPGSANGRPAVKGTRSRSRIRMQFVTDGERGPGIQLVERLLTTGERDSVELTPAIALEAMEALEHVELPWLVDEMVESGERFAAQVHSRATRGLQEVVQNAEDQGAENIRFGVRRRAGTLELLIAHDGHPVELYDVVSMAYPLLSGSRADPDKIGRFGIGLKTLNQIGERLAVHCPPLPGFEITGGRIKVIRAARAIPGFWNPKIRETLFVLRIEEEGFGSAFFKEWLAGWEPSSLLFLRHLRRVTFVDLNRKKVLIERAVAVGKTRAVSLNFPGAQSAEQVLIKEVGRSQQWTRYSIRYPRPKNLRATHKQMGDTVLLHLAVPDRPCDGRIYVGLPLEETSDLPYSFSAPFEPNVDRTHLRDHNNLNEWLIARIGDLATAVSLRRFEGRPRGAWLSVPLREESAGGSEWARAQFTKMVHRQRERVARKVRLALPNGVPVRLGELAYEPKEFDGLLTSSDIERLWNEASWRSGSRRAVPKEWRDSGRWRTVLEDFGRASSQLPASECLAILGWPDPEIESRGARWLVDLVSSGLAAGVGQELWKRRCIVLAGDGGRLSPADIDEGGTLLVHALPKEGLAASLGLAHQVARPFRARDGSAETVRRWLIEKGVLREKASDAEALRALGRARREAPIDLRRRDAVLVRIRNSFEQLASAERDALGPGIGKNIALQGFTFQRGKKEARPVRPCDAYLPSAIDKNEGWPSAAAQTPELRWVDSRYGRLLRGARGQGALAFLKALGAATAPRLEPGNPPSEDPHAARLVQRQLCAQHQEELAEYPRATGLSDDWVSPDLEAVIVNLTSERRSTIRRKRARALFLALDRAWAEQYGARSTARAVRHYYTWNHYGDVSATWVARLASEPWLSTRESQFRPAPPRELTVLTEAAFEIEGQHPEKYAAEIDYEHVDSLVVDALGIQGRPFASSILERIEAMCEAERNGKEVAQVSADRSYQALASYAPGGPYADRSDLTTRQIQRAFGRRNGSAGLIRVDGVWFSPRQVRRDPYLDESLPRVTGADTLWDLLGVVAPTPDDCVEVMKALAARRESNQSGEVRVFRHLLWLNGMRRLPKKVLGSLPLRTYSGWQRRNKQALYAVANPALAEALGQKRVVWRSPLPLDELMEIIPSLGVRVLDDSHFAPEISSHAAAIDSDVQSTFANAVGRLKDYLAVHHIGLHDRLSNRDWNELQQARVVVGSGWAIRVKGVGRQSVRLSVRAHLFRDPLRFCVLHEDEAANPESGGQAIASFFIGNQPAPEDRSTLALAWAYAFQTREEQRQEIELAVPDGPEDAPPPMDFEEFRGKARRRRARRRTQRGPSGKQEAPRQLVDLDDIDLADVSGTFLEARRRGKLKVSPKAKISDPVKTRDKTGQNTGTRSGQRHYTDSDREDRAYRIVEAILEDTRGLRLEDIRDQGTVGADAVDRDQDIWIELKAHGRDAADTLRLEPAEALRAEEKRGRYWLVVVWNLEKPRTPEFVVIPDPLRRLDMYVAGGLRLTGVRELAEAE
jgi:hypothetical protein